MPNEEKEVKTIIESDDEDDVPQFMKDWKIKVDKEKEKIKKILTAKNELFTEEKVIYMAKHNVGAPRNTDRWED